MLHYLVIQSRNKTEILELLQAIKGQVGNESLSVTMGTLADTDQLVPQPRSRPDVRTEASPIISSLTTSSPPTTPHVQRDVLVPGVHKGYTMSSGAFNGA
jgi:hypothetical protein